MKIGVLAAITALLFLAACGNGDTVDAGITPFIGGTEGIDIDFLDTRTEVFDAGQDPFDVNIKLKNQGEWAVPKEKARLRLSGVYPREFGKLEEEFSAIPQDDVSKKWKDSEGNIIDSPQVTVEFKNLNYLSALTGAYLEFPLVASICYDYGTNAEVLLCVRKNILNPESGGVCEISESKTVYNSGAPVHIENLKESARAADKIGFGFDIVERGSGRVYEAGSSCIIENKVWVKVDTRMSGLSCTGLTSSGGSAQGTVTLFEGKKTISCTQQVSADDYEKRLAITLNYGYEDSEETTIRVKRSAS